MRKGILELCILAIISKKECYPSEILSALHETELIVVEGTIYPLLTRLKNDGLLTYRWEESTGGPPRKYFTITPEGVVALEELTMSWQKLAASVNTLMK
jgi:PadR family transcriptional regulator PadR